MKNHEAKMFGKNDDRDINDLYDTPTFVVEELLKREVFIGNIWEPACGHGNISNTLKQFLKNNIIYSDLNNYGLGNESIDFLKYDGVPQDNIITNPPYSLALDFVLQAKNYSKCKIAMLLRTLFLEGKNRYYMFNDREFPLKSVYQFSRRVNMTHTEQHGKRNGIIAFAWFVWDKEYKGKPTIDWIL